MARKKNKILSKIKGLLMPVVLASVFVGGLAIMFTNNSGGGSGNSAPSANSVDIIVPELGAQAKAGEALFNKNCSACHGENARGTNSGPSFIQDIYNPGHHPDGAFVRAAATGVPAHHWPFGDMPVINSVTSEEVLTIVRYIRDLQFANGIVTRPHVMGGG